MQACNQCHADYINETVKYIFFILAERYFFSTISHNRQITSYYYFPLKKNFEKKMNKKKFDLPK